VRQFTFKNYFKDDDVQFFIIEQITPGPFNRGALCNIGFLEVCKTRPDGLFIFHDVDIYPLAENSIDYKTNKGNIRHPVGIKNTNLETICCFWKDEFEKVNGFPNYWGWGLEDVTIMYRALKEKIPIDENNIIDINDSSKCHNPGHYRGSDNYKYAEINAKLHTLEMESGINNNGLNSIKYDIVSNFELHKKFNVIDVDFKLIGS
jgi:hypothetical protein